MTVQTCRFDFLNGDRGRLQCQLKGHQDHRLLAFAVPAGRPSLLRSLLDQGKLTGAAEREALQLPKEPA